MQLVLDTNGLAIKKRNNAFWILAKEGRRLISPHRVSSIAVTADCLFSASAIRLAAQHGIPIYFFDRAGRAQARLWSADFGSIATIRREQALYAKQTAATRWVIDLFRHKAAQQVSTLRYLKQRKRNTRLETDLQQGMYEIETNLRAIDAYADQLIEDCRQSLMGIEGGMARRYWQLLSASLPTEWQFAARSRRPAKDPFNAAINYLYGMLYNTVGAAALAAGLDTHLGFLHADQYAKPTFVFDLIEPFRPWADRILVQACLDQQLKPSFFDEKDQAYTLNQAGRRFIIPLFNAMMQERISFDGQRLSRQNHLYRMAGTFAQTLLARAPDELQALDDTGEGWSEIP